MNVLDEIDWYYHIAKTKVMNKLYDWGILERPIRVGFNVNDEDTMIIGKM